MFMDVLDDDPLLTFVPRRRLNAKSRMSFAQHYTTLMCE